MIKQGLYVATPNWFGKTELKNDSQNIKVANAHTVPNTSNIILKTEGQGNGISRISSLNNVITVTKDTFSKQEIDILTTTDSDSPSDSNVFSAKRTLAEIQELIEQGGGGGSEDNFDDRYIRKDQTDTTNFLLNLLGGIILGDNGLKSNNFSTGILGSGFCLKNLDGDSYLEVDRMLVRKVATFVLLLIQELKHVGGQIILTPASMDCSRVEEFDSYYRCYFDNTDGEKTIEQQFVVGDLARAQTFNKTVNTYYWRAVVGVGDNYIDLSKDDCDAGSTIPNAGDEIVQLGNKTESSRLAAIVLSSYGNDAPYIKMYRGINSYLLDGKEFTSFSRSQVMIIADQLKFSSGESIKDEIDNVSLKVDGTDLKVDEAISDLAENILFVTELSKDLEAVKNLVDGSIETWFYDPVPTLLNIPAINWITTEDKNLHLGDLYYDGNGKAYRFQMSGSNYAWLIITDSDITKALADAKAAQDTADGKRRVFAVAPTNASEYDVGDLWVNATYGEYDNDLLRCKTAKKTNEQWSISHWELASKYTDDTIANAAQEAADAAKQTADDALLAANDAKENANIANALLADIANDNKLTAQEKQQTKKEWDIIVSEKPKNDASADSFKVDRTAYGNAYNTLYAYITPLLLDLTTTSNIVGSTFRNTFKNYYASRTDLLNAISKKAKSIADAALNTADNAAENALLAIEDAANAKVAADNALQDATEAKERLDSWAEDGVISPTEKQSLKDEINRIDADKTQITDSYTKYSLGTPTKYNNAYTAYRNLLVTLTATSSETIPIPNDFASKLVTYYSERTNALIKISDAAKNYVNGLISGVLGLIDDIKQDAVEAVTNAATALKKANEAANRLNQWASDGVISPTEKLTLKQEQLKLIAEKDAIVVDANKYGVNTTSYVTAFNNYNAELTYHTKSTPENITIRSSFATNQSAYYTAYKSINDAIATAAKKAISDVATDLNGYKSTVSSQFEATNNSIIAAVTSSKEYTNNAISTVNNDLVLYKEDVSAQFSVLEGEINSKISSTEITTIKTEILNTAATDATTKANDAKTSAISTASADATSKANKAKQDAISTAATDATNKANKAKNDAITTAGQNADKKYATITTVSSMQTSITQLSSSLSLKAEKSEVTAVQSSLNQTNNNLSSLTTRVSEAEVKLQPDNIWIGISSKVTTTSKVNNIVPDSCFDDANYSLLYTGGSRVSASTANNSCPTSYCMKSTQRDVQAKNYVAVAEGEKYYVSAYVNAQLANYTVRVGLILKKSDGTTSWHNNGSSVAAKTSGWQKLSGYITIPAGYTKAGIWFQIDGGSNFGSAYFTKVYAYKVDESVNQNYALLTSNEKRLTTFNNVVNQAWGVYNVKGLKAGDIVTVSFEYQASNLNFNTTSERTARITTQFTEQYGWVGGNFDLRTNGSGKFISTPFTIGGSATENSVVVFRFRLDYISSVLQNGSPIGYFRVWNLKVEKGERSTPWSAAPSDYSTTEEIKAGMQITDKGFNFFGQEFNFSGRISVGDLDPTIIEDGYLRASLINADTLVAKTLNAVNSKGINTLVDKDGITLTDSSTKNVLLKTEIIGTSAASYAGSLVLKGGFSSGSSREANLSAFSLTMSSDGGGTSDKYSINLSQYGLQVFTNSKGLSRPRIVWCGYISGSGIISRQYGNYLSVRVKRNSTGNYTVTHNIGMSAYYAFVNPVLGGFICVAQINNMSSNSFLYTVANANDGAQKTVDVPCMVFIVYNPSNIMDA